MTLERPEVTEKQIRDRQRALQGWSLVYARDIKKGRDLQTETK
jgi:hypothetical protein